MSSPPAKNASDNNPLARANELWKQERFPEAEAAYRDVLETNPRAAWALYRLGEIYERRDDHLSAESFFSRAIALDATLAELRNSATFWKRFKAANDLLEARNFSAAEPIFIELLGRNPNSASVLAKLGKIAGEHGRTADALAYYDRATATEPNSPLGYIGKAEVLDGLGQTSEALHILEAVQAGAGAPQMVKDRVNVLRRKLRLIGEGAKNAHTRRWPANGGKSTHAERTGPRVAVVSWCLAHSTVVRAMVLAETAASAGLSAEIVGPIFPSHGEDLWPPLRDGAREAGVYGFLAPSFADFVEGAIRLVMHRPAEIVWVSKPRFPSLLIGFLYKLIHGAGLVLDIDDDELAAVGADAPLNVDDFLQDLTPADWREPYSKRWTRLANTLIPHADAITVCSTVLQQKFGGTIVSAPEANLTEALAPALNSLGPENRRRAFLPADVRRIFNLLDTSMPGLLPDDCRTATKGVFRVGPRVGALTNLRRGVNLVFFGKHNDSGIYGGRPDMLLQQFAAIPNIRRILHIDAPISVDALGTLAAAGDAKERGHFVVSNTISRFLEVSDDDRVARRSFVYRGKETQLLGRELPQVDEFPNAVEAWLTQLGMTENVLAWVCPVVHGFPQVQRRLCFSFVAADVTGDQRQWPMQPASLSLVEQNYRETFAHTRAAFANCDTVGNWLTQEGLDPLVVPNGMDIFDNIDSWITPDAIAHLPRPVVGYCGNLTHGIDWDLIEHVAAARPNWSIVLIGEPGKDDRCRTVTSRYNVHMLGVLPYEAVCRHVAAFDAAMIPHTNATYSSQADTPTPEVYGSAGVPVVSTAAASLGEVAASIRVATAPEEFVMKLDAAVAERRVQGRLFPPQATMQTLSWRTRASTIWQRLEDVFEAR